MAVKMTDERRREFLAAGTRTAKIVTLHADGQPHVVPLWFVVDGDDIVGVTVPSTVKGRNLSRDPRTAIVVDDEAPPFAFVSINGTAEFSDDPEEVRRFAFRIGQRYMGENAEDFVGYAVGGGMVVLRVRPERILAHDKIVGE